ncbi:ADP-ribosyltransferase [Anthocerotibacter panamensis]|uniref:ADP-ribosyltransferase n=1 Tax=Anthocerotibacter panamensis TaxID=2857077 RepID=UPI001C4052BB|nr:ADP-ribosyltransferase [Anthocerotibacter panamensis]
MVFSRDPKPSSSSHIPQPPEISPFAPPPVQVQPVEDEPPMPVYRSIIDDFLTNNPFKPVPGEPVSGQRRLSPIRIPPVSAEVQREELPEEETLQMQPLVQRQDASSLLNVAAMNSTQKLEAALKRTLPLLPTEVRAKVQALLSPEALATMVAVAAVWAASHAVGVGEVIDLVLLGLGVLALGTEVVGVVQDVGGFVTGSLDAKSTVDLDRAAEHLARAIATVGVDTVIALLTRGLGKKAKATRSTNLTRYRSTPKVRSEFRERFINQEPHFQKSEAYISQLKAVFPELKDIPNEDLIGVRGYTSNDYTKLNTALRSKDPKQLAELDSYFKTASSGINHLPPYKGEVYRGTNLSPEIAARYKVGKIVTEDAFTSATIDRGSKFGGNTEFVIQSVNGRDISFLSEIPSEKEVLFAPGTRFKVLSVDIEPMAGHRTIYLLENP